MYTDSRLGHVTLNTTHTNMSPRKRNSRYAHAMHQVSNAKTASSTKKEDIEFLNVKDARQLRG